MMVQAKQDVDNATAKGEEVRAKAWEEMNNGGIKPDTMAALEKLNTAEESTLARGDLAMENNGYLGNIGRAFRTVGNKFGLNDETGTLKEAGTLITARTDEGYLKGHSDTKRLLEYGKEGLGASAETAEEFKKILLSGANDAAAILRNGPAGPNRCPAPTGDIKNNTK
jgi:hypothetical protein